MRTTGYRSHLNDYANQHFTKAWNSGGLERRNLVWKRNAGSGSDGVDEHHAIATVAIDRNDAEH